MPRGVLFGVLDLSNVWAMYFTVFAIFMAGFLLIYRVIHSPFGPVAGASVIITMENYLAQLGAWVTIAQGAIFVVCVLTFRRGVIGEIANFIKQPL